MAAGSGKSGDIVVTPPYRILPTPKADRDGGVVIPVCAAVGRYRAVVRFDDEELSFGPHRTEEGCWEAVRRFVNERFGIQLADLADYRRLPITLPS